MKRTLSALIAVGIILAACSSPKVSENTSSVEIVKHRHTSVRRTPARNIHVNT